jgi:uncharacterized repeat protein (TIGR02543 family)
MSGVHVRSNSDTWTAVTGIYVRSNSDTWTQVTAGYVRDNSDTWVQFWPTTRAYTFYLGNTVYIGTNGYISFDSGQTALSIVDTVGRVLGILPADLVTNSIRWAADSSKFYMFFRGRRFSSATNFEIEYEVHFTDGQDYALIKLVAFPSDTYSNTAYYVDGSRTGYSAITSGRTVGAEYRVYFGTTAAFSTTFTEYGSSTAALWLASSTPTSGTLDDGYFTIAANQGSSPSAPTSMAASSITTTSATVSWGVPTNKGMSEIQSYAYSTNGGGSWSSTGSGTSVNLTGLTANTSYTVLARATNYFFTGTNYASVTFTTLASLTAPTITSVTSPYFYAQSLSVNFTGGSGPFYQMYWTTSATAPNVPVTADAAGSSSPLTDAIGPGTAGTYYMYVRSTSTFSETSVGPSAVASAWSAGFSFTVSAFVVTFDNNSATSGSPSVSSVTASFNGGSVTLATVGTLARTGYNFGGWNTATDGSGTNYSPGTSYIPTASITLYAKWNVPKPPNTPTSPKAYATTGTTITFEWTAGVTDSTHDAATSYDIYYSTEATAPTSSTTATTTSTTASKSISVTGGTRYYFWVRGVNTDGKSDWTSSIYAKTGTATIAGTLATGGILSVTIVNEAEENGNTLTKSYQWQRFRPAIDLDFTNLSGQTGSTYSVLAADARFQFRCLVTWTGTWGTENFTTNTLTIPAPSVSAVSGATSNNTNPYVTYTVTGHVNTSSIDTIVAYAATTPPGILSPASGVSTSSGLTRAVGSRSGTTANYYRLYYLLPWSGGSGTGVSGTARQSTTIQRANAVASVSLPISNF